MCAVLSHLIIAIERPLLVTLDLLRISSCSIKSTRGILTVLVCSPLYCSLSDFDFSYNIFLKLNIHWLVCFHNDPPKRSRDLTKFVTTYLRILYFIAGNKFRQETRRIFMKPYKSMDVEFSKNLRRHMKLLKLIFRQVALF